METFSYLKLHHLILENIEQLQWYFGRIDAQFQFVAFILFF